MKLDGRRQAIMDLLMESGTVSLDELAAQFGVSKMTVHRDLDELQDAGLLRKVRGGATLQSSAQFESDFRYRERQAIEEKRRIAAAAAQLVEPGQTVMIGDGSTVGNIAKLLVDIRPLTVITNNLAVVQELNDASGLQLISPGGQYNRKYNGFFGLVAEDALRALRADIAFLSTSAIHGAAAFHQEPEVLRSKRLMMAGSGQRFLVVDHGKFGRSALHFFSELNRFDAVLTGGQPEAASRVALDAAGVTLRVIA